ncbi:MAG TPA: cytochrome c oxidase subunit 3 [Polyangiaceae bacterium]|nr:cytochrome c oxidase subunit 3 [Polyangiaceae bacterium]
MNSVHAEHFESAPKQAHAARLGMWIFLASELLLFAGLFALYGGYRAHWPAAFREGIRHSTKALGSLNTGILLVSSTFAALSVHATRAGRRSRSLLLLAGTFLLGLLFLGIKLYEYSLHFREGIYPGGSGAFFSAHPDPGLVPFWTLYFATTGLHAIHVSVGLIVLGCTCFALWRGTVGVHRAHPLENAALYWHLIDTIWIFVWPLYYLA